MVSNEKIEEKKILTKDQIAYIVEFYVIFKAAYYRRTFKRLESFEQMIEVIEDGTFTFDEVFMDHIDNCLAHAEQDLEIFWEDNMKLFDVENYFPETNKQIGDGAWIKIHTEHGFEIHYAKRANRKRRFSEEYDIINSKLERLLKSDTRELKKQIETKVFEPLTNSEQKIKKLKDQLLELEIRSRIGLKLYEVKINRSKSKAEYYLPYQYTLVEDVEEFSSAYVNNTPGVTAKCLYTSQNKDIIFYLQSRGISKKKAEMLSALKQTYFKVDMQEAMSAYSTFLKEHEEFVCTN